jgi:membrane-associated phospholipid phosphatase
LRTAQGCEPVCADNAHSDSAAVAAYEWLVVVYFSGLTAAAWLTRVRRPGRLHLSILGAVLALIALGAAIWPRSWVRAWVPHLYLVAGYWMPALLALRVEESAFERWLARSDSRCRRMLPAVPRLFVPLVELAYLFCFPLVPLAFVIVWLMGGPPDVERFWLAVLLAGYACYVSLPWLISRPPRFREHQVERPGLARFNEFVLARVSHRLNTFPSGHVAVGAAAAAGVAGVSPLAAGAIGVVVVAISVGAVAGRYHYVLDVVLGLAVAAVAVMVAGRAA